MANELKGGAWLKAARRRCGLSQEALAEQVGATKNAVYMWERDMRVPQLRNQRLIADALRASTEEVIEAFGGVKLSIVPPKASPPAQVSLQEVLNRIAVLERLLHATVADLHLR